MVQYSVDPFLHTNFGQHWQRAVGVAFSALTRLGSRKGIQPVQMGGWWRWALISPAGVAPSRMVVVSASVNLLLHNKVQKFSPGTGSHRWSRKNGRKMVVVVVVAKGGWYRSPYDSKFRQSHMVFQGFIALQWSM